MSEVMILLGSNTLPAAHIRWASQRLARLLADVRFSRTLWTEDIRGTGVWYMNRLAWGRTELTADELQRELKAVEAETGRNGQQVTIDLDLMQHGGRRYHERDWSRNYVRQLLPDIL